MGAFRTSMGYNERHGHEFYEIVLVAAGKGFHFLYEPGSDVVDRYAVTEGDLFLIPPGWSHGYDDPDGAQIYNIIWDRSFLQEDFAWQQPVSELFRVLSGGEPQSGDPLLRKIHLGSVERTALEGCLVAVSRETWMRHASFRFLAKAKLMEALTVIDRAHAARMGGLRDISALLDSGGPVARAVTYMESHFTEDVSLDEIARSAHLSTAYFCEVFRNATGLTPMKYLNRLRLEHARYLLLRGGLPVQTVSAQCGFQDASYFTRAFKDFYQQTPRQVQNIGKKS